MPDCINLREEFGDRYRVSYEESYHADLGKGVHRGDPWLQVIECTGGRGHFFPWGGNKLAASVDRPRVANRVRELECCEVVQDGESDGVTVVFDVSDIDVVAEIMKPKRRRKQSAEHRARSTERLEAWRQRSRQDDRDVRQRDSARRQTDTVSRPVAATGSRSSG